ncbi:MAG: hypothetical protein Nk1A_7600 [Endomicrobiia bacterium]|nr:MAG: hypothetical protein NkDv07_0586 [Candidatus Improbicoccus devescovinae]GMO68792.1 MAG: hypothetical protein Nk1A_7600 [Endomicrobiia bacterium]
MCRHYLENIIWRKVKTGWINEYFDYYSMLLNESEGNFCKDKNVLEYSKKLRNEIIKKCESLNKKEENKKISIYEIEEIMQLIKTILLFESRINFDSYCQYIEFQRESSKQFYFPRRKVLKSIANDMNSLVDGGLELLSISMPPGTGKSTLGIFLLSWVMGKNPNAPNLVSAHSGTLTRSFYDGVLGIISNPEYLWKDVFPNNIRIITNAKDETIDLNEIRRFSSLTCRAINASLTGAARCEGILYCDDLCSGIEEALNRERMESLWVKYTNDLKSRKKMSSKELHIATRWTVHDVIGKLEIEYADKENVKFISIPAINETGESNFNYDFKLGFDKKYFLDMKRQLDEASFSALYMNEPFEREGILFRESELRRYFELPDEEPDSIISICDCKDIGGDYLFLPIAYVFGHDYYIEDCVCNNGDLGILDGIVTSILNKHKVKACRFESNASGARFAEKIQSMIKDSGGNTHINGRIEVYDSSNKLICDLDKDGIEVFCNNGSIIRLNANEGLAGYDPDGTKFYQATKMNSR